MKPRISPSENRHWGSREWNSLFAVFGFLGILLAVVAIVVGKQIPEEISANERAVASDERCLDDLLAMRADLVALRRGYELSPAEKNARLSDWDAVAYSVESVGLTCESQLEARAKLDLEFYDKKQVLAGEILVNYSGRWAEANTLELIDWTNRIVSEIAN